MKKELSEKLDHYHLMIEEVLGGMDLMLTSMDKRISRIEKHMGIKTQDGLNKNGNEIKKLREEVAQLKEEMDAGLNLAFRKINE